IEMAMLVAGIAVFVVGIVGPRGVKGAGLAFAGALMALQFPTVFAIGFFWAASQKRASKVLGADDILFLTYVDVVTVGVLSFLAGLFVLGGLVIARGAGSALRIVVGIPLCLVSIFMLALCFTDAGPIGHQKDWIRNGFTWWSPPDKTVSLYMPGRPER